MIKISLFERMKKLHWPSVRLTEQHRMVEGLTWYSNKMCYNGELIDGAGTSLADRPLARRLKAFLEQEYKANAVACLFDVNNTETRLVGTSRRNDSMALATGAWLMRLFTFFTELRTKEICIATLYQAQIKAYTGMLATLDKVPAWHALKLGKISVSTIDSVQGTE